MMKLARLLLIPFAAFLAVTHSARAATPPDVPPIADSDRYQSYTLNATTTAVDVTFPVFGDGSDLVVRLNGVAVTTGWTFVSKSGSSITAIALPITDGQLQFSPALTAGTLLEIVGSWRPRLLTQPSAPGITRREFNYSTSAIVASQRELWQVIKALGYTLRSGSGAPTSGVGRNGDFYIDTANARLYGPKTLGAWSSSFTAIAGTPGATGATGATGPAWNQWKGPWSNATAYVVNDVVSLNGSSYIAVANSTNSAPPSANWNLIAQAGANGTGVGDMLKSIYDANNDGIIDQAASVPWSGVSSKPAFATVATSGAYTDLTGRPSLATVATSGSYTDLSSKPTLGTAAPLNVGTAANNVVQLDGSAKLPAVDGSQLTNLKSSPPIIVSRIDSNVYQTGPTGGTGAQAVTASIIYATPFVVSRQQTYTKIGVSVSTAGGTSAYLAIYNDASNGQPGTLAVDAGSVSTASTGSKEATISKTLAPGLYWLVCAFDSTPTVTSAGYNAAPLGRNSSLTQITALTRSFTPGAFPSDESGQTYTGWTTTTLVPIVWLRN